MRRALFPYSNRFYDSGATAFPLRNGSSLHFALCGIRNIVCNGRSASHVHIRPVMNSKDYTAVCISLFFLFLKHFPIHTLSVSVISHQKFIGVGKKFLRNATCLLKKSLRREKWENLFREDQRRSCSVVCYRDGWYLSLRPTIRLKTRAPGFESASSAMK